MNDGIKTLYCLRAYDISFRFPIKLLTHLALKKDFLFDDQTFSLKSGAFSWVISRIPSLETAHDWKIFLILFLT